MFDFAPVGVAVATLGVIFVAVIGWRLVPARKSAAGDSFDSGSYLTDVRVPEKSKAVGLTLRALEAEIGDSGAQIIGLVRDEVRMTAPSGGRRIKAGDVLVLQADVDALAEALSVFGIKLEEEALRGSISPVFCGCEAARFGDGFESGFLRAALVAGTSILPTAFPDQSSLARMVQNGQKIDPQAGDRPWKLIRISPVCSRPRILVGSLLLTPSRGTVLRSRFWLRLCRDVAVVKV